MFPIYCKQNSKFLIFIFSMMLSVSAWSDMTSPIDSIKFRAHAAAGPRVINNQMMKKTRYDMAMALGLSALKHCQSLSCYVGLQFLVNNSWDSRFNSVNDSTDTSTTTTLVHHSSSLDIMVLGGRQLGQWFMEASAGAQFAFIKWLSSPQFAEDKLRVVPKFRLSIGRKMTDNTSVFAAFDQTINTYGKLRCASGAANCVNDSGYVPVSSFKLGVSFNLY